MSFGFSAGDFIAAANLAYKLVLALSDSTGSSSQYQQLIQDLSCVHRTLLQVEKMKYANQLNQSTINALRHQVDGAKKPMQTFLERTEKYRRSLGAGGGSGSAMKDSWRKIGWGLHKESDVKALREVLQLRLLCINVLLSTACYFVEGPAPLGQLGGGLVLENEEAVPEPNWNSDLVVFEHINEQSGGSRNVDPSFYARGQDAGSFFRVGQVFMMLWYTSNEAAKVNAVADDRSTSEEMDRPRYYTNAYSGPYTGVTTIRRFLVVHEGIRSSYCLSVTTLGLQGCSQQPDQENYGVIFTGSQPPPPLPGETGMIKQPIRVNVTHPSNAIPPQARIDFRRLCEVEHNVRCKDVGLVDVDSMTHLLGHLEPCRVNQEAESTKTGDRDDEDLDNIE